MSINDFYNNFIKYKFDNNKIKYINSIDDNTFFIFILQLEHGKYFGRNLAELYQIYFNEDGSLRISEESISTKMVKSGHAYSYYGGTKRKFDEWYK